MKYHISIHISPYEIDNYQLFIHQLRRNLNYIDNEIIFNPYLNLSNYFYDWDNSVLKSDFFINKFNELNKIVENQVTLDSVINFDNKILGALSYKREFISKYKNQVDAFIWFDSDMIFPDDLLFYLINSFESINQEYCIITPQITKLWDNTWDILVNEKYINQYPNHDNYFNFDGYKLYNQPEVKELIENNHYTKFASGWGNLLSSGLFKKYISFTDSLGHYGIDDTFIMYAIDLYKQKGNNIKQFIVNNLVVIENNKFKISSYDNLIYKNKNIKTKEDFRQESENKMIIQLNKIKNESQPTI
jgi:hypothetical protein